MLSQDLESLSMMISDLSRLHGGLTPQHVEVIRLTLKVHASRARMLEQSAVHEAAKVQAGGNVALIGDTA